MHLIENISAIFIRGSDKTAVNNMVSIQISQFYINVFIKSQKHHLHKNYMLRKASSFQAVYSQA